MLPENSLLKRFVAIGFMAVIGLCAPAQSPKQNTSLTITSEYENECGSPLTESMAWSLIAGRVTKVVGGDVIILQTSKRQRKRVSLVALDASSNRGAAHAALSRLVLNRDVTVLVNPSDESSSSLTGVVSSGVQDVNRTLIEAGLARYREPKFYAISRSKACVYRILEKQAREAKRGLWKSAAN